MKVVIHKDEQILVKKIRISLTDDVDFVISTNEFNEIVVNKAQFGEGEAAIILKPSTSNEIRLT